MNKLSVRILIGNVMCASMYALPVMASASGTTEPAPARVSRADRLQDQQMRSLQQRKDLRLALQPQQGKGGEVADPPLANRHLSAQERAEMRQQLRQQRRDSERSKP